VKSRECFSHRTLVPEAPNARAASDQFCLASIETVAQGLAPDTGTYMFGDFLGSLDASDRTLSERCLESSQCDVV